MLNRTLDHLTERGAAVGSTLLDRGLLPDAVLRAGIRAMCAQRLREQDTGSSEHNLEELLAFVQHMRNAEIAPVPDKANEQHYEVPSAFYELVLGDHLKYSCGYWANGTRDLSKAEADMLALTCERAGIEDGQRILELGCGWGSLSLWLATHYPRCEIVAVSNSISQREHIEQRAARAGVRNLRVLTRDANHFSTDERFDRIVSVEMFEHMRNWERLLSSAAGWLVDDGKLFLHFFCHARFAYPFEAEGASNWMGRYFFSGGIMPSDDLPLYFQRDLSVDRRWRVSGTHYAKTADAWLANLDRQRSAAARVLDQQHPGSGELWVRRWRAFFMACAELWGYAGGEEWFVAHYLMTRNARAG